MLATVPRFTAGSAYRTGLLDGHHCAETGGSARLAMMTRLGRPAWLVQPRRVRRAFSWGFLAGFHAVADREPGLVA
jgi:hypothetical protein